MATNRWLGIAKPTTAQTAFKPSGVTPGSIWKMRIGPNNYQYVYPGTIKKTAVSELDRAGAVAEGLAAEFSGTNGLGGGSSQFVESVAATLVDGDWAVLVTGTDDGAPLDVEFSVEEAADANVGVTVLQSGRASQNAKQVVRWPKTPTGGNLTVGYEDDETLVAYNVSAGDLETALEGLGSVGAGNVSVTGSYTDGYEIEFVGSFAGKAVSLLRAHSLNCTGTAAVKYEVTQRGGQSYTKFEMSALSGDSADVFFFTYEGESSHYLTGASDRDAIQLALESIPGFDSVNVGVVENADSTYEITLVGEFVGLATGSLEVTPTESTAAVPTITKTDGSTVPSQTEMVITVLNLPQNGFVDFIYDGSTSTISYGALTFEAINTALSGDWTCTALSRSIGEATIITLLGYDADNDMGIVKLDVSDLAGCNAMDVRQTQDPLTALNEIQQVMLKNDPDGGTFTLTHEGNTTAAIAYDAAASAIDSALEALASIGSGDVSVQGSNGGPWTVEFTGSLAATSMALLAGDGASLTIATQAAVSSSVIQSPTGPNWWDNRENWSLSAVPDSDDLVVFDVGDVPCLYGIANVAAINGIYIYRGYTGQIGLPEFRDGGTPETLQRYLSLSDVGSKIQVRIGLGEQGEGPSLVRIDTQNQEADVRVLYAQQSPDGDYTIGIAGDLASVQVANGAVGIAVHQLLTATVDSLRVSPSEQDGDNTRVDWGENATITQAEFIRGNTTGQSVPAAMTVINAGDVEIQGSGNCDQLTIRESVVQWLASGGIGKQGTIESIDVSSTLLEITSTAHGLSSGDRVFVAGFDHLSVPDGYYAIERSDADTFVLIGSAPAIPYGASTPSTVSSYYEASTLEWGLANTVRLGDNGVLDLGRLGEVRTIPAPISLESTSAQVLDPQITVDDLRLHADPGYFDEAFGLNGTYRRENGVSSTVLGGSYTGPGIIDAP